MDKKKLGKPYLKVKTNQTKRMKSKERKLNFMEGLLATNWTAKTIRNYSLEKGQINFMNADTEELSMKKKNRILDGKNILNIF